MKFILKIIKRISIIHKIRGIINNMKIKIKMIGLKKIIAINKISIIINFNKEIIIKIKTKINKNS